MKPPKLCYTLLLEPNLTFKVTIPHMQSSNSHIYQWIRPFSKPSALPESPPSGLQDNKRVSVVSVSTPISSITTIIRSRFTLVRICKDSGATPTVRFWCCDATWCSATTVVDLSVLCIGSRFKDEYNDLWDIGWL